MTNIISAAVHQDAIHSVSRFFNSTTHDCISELLQNARRSGASQVHISTNLHSISVSDDGHGLNDPSDILAFGHSSWPHHASTEHPAGMGIFSLARRDHIAIQSRSANPDAAWRINLTPEHFLGYRTLPSNPLTPRASPR